MKKSLGPIQFEYDRTEGLKRKPRIITIIASLMVYVVLVYGILESSITNVVISITVATIVCIAMKRWFKYKEAKQNRQELYSDM